MVCGPNTLLPKYISSLGVQVELDVKKALAWCDVANVLRIQLERQQILAPTLIRASLRPPARRIHGNFPSQGTAPRFLLCVCLSRTFPPPRRSVRLTLKCTNSLVAAS